MDAIHVYIWYHVSVMSYPKNRLIIRTVGGVTALDTRRIVVLKFVQMYVG